MKHNKLAFAVVLILIFILTSALSFADGWRYKKKYEITITNLTRDQVFSHPIAIGHDGKFRLFTVGKDASEELAALAEEGDTDPLEGLVYGRYPSVVFDGPIPPGATASATVEMGRFRLISVAGMLVGTNDAFFAAHDVWLLGKRKTTVMVPAYDAGSEINSEDCQDIPGPPCGNGSNLHPADDPSDYVHIHAGIHGIKDVNPSDYDWRNPVALIKIQRIYY